MFTLRLRKHGARRPSTQTQEPALRNRQADSDAQRRWVVTIALAINALMFAVEIGAAVAASSTALLADAIDMLADALVLGISLLAVSRGEAWKLAASRFKGHIMVAFGVLVLVQVSWKFAHPTLPRHEIIEIVSVLALLANVACISLLWQHRGQDLNMRSLWLCSRNDVIANLGTLAAGILVWLTAQQWPDLVVGAAIAALSIATGLQVLRESERVQSQRARWRVRNT